MTGKIAVSPNAVAVAHVLAELGINSPKSAPVLASDALLAQTLGVIPDTAYRALSELSELGAIKYSRPQEGARKITAVPSSWVWVALGQGAAK